MICPSTNSFLWHLSISATAFQISWDSTLQRNETICQLKIDKICLPQKTLCCSYASAHSWEIQDKFWCKIFSAKLYSIVYKIKINLWWDIASTIELGTGTVKYSSNHFVLLQWLWWENSTTKWRIFKAFLKWIVQISQNGKKADALQW